MMFNCSLTLKYTFICKIICCTAMYIFLKIKCRVTHRNDAAYLSKNV